MDNLVLDGFAIAVGGPPEGAGALCTKGNLEGGHGLHVASDAFELRWSRTVVMRMDDRLPEEVGQCCAKREPAHNDALEVNVQVLGDRSTKTLVRHSAHMLRELFDLCVDLRLALEGGKIPERLVSA